MPDDLHTVAVDVREYYERYWSASGYNPRRAAPPEYLRRLFELHVRTTDDCVDIGCGDGGTSGTYLNTKARSYVGVDVSQAAVDLARASGLSAIRVQDASRLPFDDGSFDVAVCTEVLEHLIAPLAAAEEARRVLRPAGRLIVTVPNIAYWRDRIDSIFGVWQPGGDNHARKEPWRSPHIRFFRPATLEQMLRTAGFARIEVFGLPSPLLGRVPIARRFSGQPGLLANVAARVAPALLAGQIAAIAVK